MLRKLIQGLKSSMMIGLSICLLGIACSSKVPLQSKLLHPSVSWTLDAANTKNEWAAESSLSLNNVKIVRTHVRNSLIEKRFVDCSIADGSTEMYVSDVGEEVVLLTIGDDPFGAASNSRKIVRIIYTRFVSSDHNLENLRRLCPNFIK